MLRILLRAARPFQGPLGVRNEGTALKSETYRHTYPWTQRENFSGWMRRRQVRYQDFELQGLVVQERTGWIRKYSYLLIPFGCALYFLTLLEGAVWHSGVLKELEQKRRARKAKQGL